jgi:hypothetical protein
MELIDYIGKIVSISVEHNYRLTGKLSNHKLGLYQVTGNNNHMVFWEDEVLCLHIEQSSHTLTIFI